MSHKLKIGEPIVWMKRDYGSNSSVWHIKYGTLASNRGNHLDVMELDGTTGYADRSYIFRIKSETIEYIRAFIAYAEMQDKMNADIQQATLTVRVKWKPAEQLADGNLKAARSRLSPEDH